MPESNPYENFSTEFLAEASENISQFERYFEDHTKLIIAATLFPTIVDKGDLLAGYRELLSTFKAVIGAGAMAADAELITRDLTDIDPNN